MDRQLFMGIDIGSTGIKGVLADQEGRTLFSHTRSYEISQPHLGWAEQDPKLWWQGALSIFQKMVEQEPDARSSLEGIFITGMVPNLVPLDASGEPLGPAILYRDNRAVQQCEELNRRYGFSLGMQDLIPKLQWIKEQEPVRFSRIAAVLNSHSYLVYRLTGKITADADISSLWGAGIYSRDGGWHYGLIEELGFPGSIFPRTLFPGEVAGPVAEAVANILGLNCFPKVMAGNGDSFSSMLGTGATRAGDGMIYLGTAATLWHIDTDLENIAKGLIFSSGKVSFVGNVLTGGELLRWFCYGMQIGGRALSLGDLDREAGSVPAGSEGLITIPHLMGKRTPNPAPDARGGILGLSTYHSPWHIYRSLMESVAYNLYESYLASGLTLNRLLVTGGGGRSSLWRSIIATVFQQELLWYPEGDPPLGDAYFAAYSLGRFDSFAPLRERWLGTLVVTPPLERDIPAYREGFEAYMNYQRSLNVAAEENENIGQ